MTERRKPRKRHPVERVVQINDDLKELASVLDEHQLDRNATGWFVIPWNDGYHAMWLAIECFESILDQYSSDRERQTYEWLKNLSRPVAASADSYYKARDLLERIDVEDVSTYLQAALRCLQIWISNSSGGGAVYNHVLRAAFDKAEPSYLFEDVVLNRRCLDALGVSSQLTGDKFDRYRRAFSIAWKRGLFHAAYSIAPRSIT